MQMPVVKPKEYPKCVIPSCQSVTNIGRGLIFFTFPNHGNQRYHQWCNVTGLTDLPKSQSHYICQKHFTSGDICRNRLKRTAIPTLHMDKVKETESAISMDAVKTEVIGITSNDLEDSIRSEQLVALTVDYVDACPKKWPDPPEICRFCLMPKPNMETLVAFDPAYQELLATMYERITSIAVRAFDPSDGCSLNICEDCESNIKKAYQIRDDFIRANDWWQNYLVTSYQQGQCEENHSTMVKIEENSVVSAEDYVAELMESTDANDDDSLETDALAENKSYNQPSDSVIINKGKYKPSVKSKKKQIRRTASTTKKTFTSQRHELKNINQSADTTNISNQCHWCDQKINNFRQHVLTVHPNAEWLECDKCGSKFPHKRRLLFHWRRRHLTAKLFQCSFCAKAFTQRNFLVQHERIHTGEKPYVCDICSRAFAQSTVLKMHLKNVHSASNGGKCYDGSRYDRAANTRAFNAGSRPTDGTTIKCNLCDYGTTSVHTLLKHLTKSHGDEGRLQANTFRSVYCPKCHSFFENAAERKAHAKEHLRYKCDFCSKRFSNCDAVQLHMRVHKSGLRPHVCTICRASFNSSSHLRRHHRYVHANDRQFKCDQCSKAFEENYALIRHQRSEHLHLREPKKCEYCSLEFYSSHGLNSHMGRMHTNTERFKCSICAVVCCEAKKLEMHHRRFHTDINH